MSIYDVEFVDNIVPLPLACSDNNYCIHYSIILLLKDLRLSRGNLAVTDDVRTSRSKMASMMM